MSIFLLKSHVEVYRRRAGVGLAELSGRGELATCAVNRHIAEKMEFRRGDTVIDVGCGDGSLLWELRDTIEHGLGVVPTQEECERLVAIRSHPHLQFSVGTAQRTGVPAPARKVVCNGVLLLLDDQFAFDAALDELVRLTEPGGSIWIGEVPEVDELAGQRDPYDRPLDWFRQVRSRDGIIGLARTVGWYLRANLSKRVHTINMLRLLSQTPAEMNAHFSKRGLVLTWRGRSLEGEGESKTRWDYLVRRG